MGDLLDIAAPDDPGPAIAEGNPPIRPTHCCLMDAPPLITPVFAASIVGSIRYVSPVHLLRPGRQHRCHLRHRIPGVDRRRPPVHQRLPRRAPSVPVPRRRTRDHLRTTLHSTGQPPLGRDPHRLSTSATTRSGKQVAKMAAGAQLPRNTPRAWVQAHRTGNITSRDPSLGPGRVQQMIAIRTIFSGLARTSDEGWKGPACP